MNYASQNATQHIYIEWHMCVQYNLSSEKEAGSDECNHKKDESSNMLFVISAQRAN